MIAVFFRRALAFGKGATAPLRGGELPSVEERERWDGKDGEVCNNYMYLLLNSLLCRSFLIFCDWLQLPEEEDIDLSDVFLDDDDLDKDEL